MLIRIRMDKGESTIDASHARLLERLKSENIPTVGISFGSPYLPSYDSLDAYMCAYGYGSISIKAAANAYPALGSRVFNPQQQIPMAWPESASE